MTHPNEVLSQSFESVQWEVLIMANQGYAIYPIFRLSY